MTPRTRSLPVLDATCPLVSKVHSQAKHYVAQGRTMILIGHRGHPEVEGTMGQVGAPVHLVSSKQDVDRLDVARDTPVAYVTQTTLSIDDTRNIIDALKERFRDIIGPDTSDICYATQNRQSAVRELCKISDVILVVGSKNSSNSNRLREIGIEEGIPSYLIADGSELDPAWIAGKKTVGLTAGASAPEKLCARRDRCAAPHRREHRSLRDGRHQGEHRVSVACRTENLRTFAGRTSERNKSGNSLLADGAHRSVRR